MLRVCIHLSVCVAVPYTLLCVCVTGRHAARRAGDIPDDAPPEAGDDVQCHAQQGDPAGLQEVHARRNLPSSTILHVSHRTALPRRVCVRPSSLCR